MIWQHAVFQCLSKEREDSCFQEAAIWIDLVGLPNCGDIFIFPNHWLCHGLTFCATWPDHTYVASKQVQNWKRWKSENVTQNPSDVSHFIPFPIYITDNKSWKLISHPWPLEDSSWSSASVFAGTARKGIPRPIKIMLFVVFCCHPLGPKKVQGSICVCTSHFLDHWRSLGPGKGGMRGCSKHYFEDGNLV